MIDRDVAGAAAAELDLVVVGGGILGACLTLEAARRGLRTVLIERYDFGGATSWNSLRIVHGGLRYLQRLDLRRHRESVRERRWFLRRFPEQVEPLSCVMPLYGDPLRRPVVLQTALAVDHLLSLRRNQGVRGDRRLPRGRVLDPAETTARWPTLARADLRGAALWTDAWMPCAPRVLIEILRWAASAGARPLNYVEATGLALDGGRVAGVTALDRVSGRSFELRAPRVVNCAGPWSRELAESFDRDLPDLFRPTLAFNLLLQRQAAADVALALTSPGGGRSFFILPWRDRMLAGTCHAAYPTDPADLDPEHPLVLAFRRDLAVAAPALGLEDARVLRVLSGRLPAAPGGGATPAMRPEIVDHADHGGPAGLVSVSGVKYTTARALAERALRISWRSDPPPIDQLRQRPLAAHWPSLEQLSGASPDDQELARRVRGLAAEEAVVELDDLILRRTDLGLDPELGAGAAELVRGWIGDRPSGAAS